MQCLKLTVVEGRGLKTKAIQVFVSVEHDRWLYRKRPVDVVDSKASFNAVFLLHVEQDSVLLIRVWATRKAPSLLGQYTLLVRSVVDAGSVEGWHLLQRRSAHGSLSNRFGGELRIFAHYASEDARASPSKDISHSSSFFGVSLEDAMKLPDNLQLSVPWVVSSIIQYLRTKGSKHINIFRVTSQITDLNFLIEKLEIEGRSNADKVLASVSNPHLVATLLKHFLSRLPTPVVSVDVCQRFTRRMTLIQVRRATKSLSIPHRSLLEQLLLLLNEVSHHSKKNRMTPYNLAVVFLPLLCPDAARVSASSDALSTIKIMQSRILGLAAAIRACSLSTSSSSSERLDDSTEDILEATLGGTSDILFEDNEMEIGFEKRTDEAGAGGSLDSSSCIPTFVEQNSSGHANTTFLDAPSLEIAENVVERFSGTESFWEDRFRQLQVLLNHREAEWQKEVSLLKERLQAEEMQRMQLMRQAPRGKEPKFHGVEVNDEHVRTQADLKHHLELLEEQFDKEEREWQLEATSLKESLVTAESQTRHLAIQLAQNRDKEDRLKVSHQALQLDLEQKEAVVQSELENVSKLLEELHDQQSLTKQLESQFVQSRENEIKLKDDHQVLMLGMEQKEYITDGEHEIVSKLFEEGSAQEARTKHLESQLVLSRENEIKVRNSHEALKLNISRKESNMKSQLEKVKVLLEESLVEESRTKLLESQLAQRRKNESKVRDSHQAFVLDMQEKKASMKSELEEVLKLLEDSRAQEVQAKDVENYLLQSEGKEPALRSELERLTSMLETSRAQEALSRNELEALIDKVGDRDRAWREQVRVLKKQLKQDASEDREASSTEGEEHLGETKSGPALDNRRVRLWREELKKLSSHAKKLQALIAEKDHEVMLAKDAERFSLKAVDETQQVLFETQKRMDSFLERDHVLQLEIDELRKLSVLFENHKEETVSVSDSGVSLESTGNAIEGEEITALREQLEHITEKLRRKDIRLSRSCETNKALSKRELELKAEASCRDEEHLSSIQSLQARIQELESNLAEKANFVKVAEMEWNLRCEEQLRSIIIARDSESMLKDRVHQLDLTLSEKEDELRVVEMEWKKRLEEQMRLMTTLRDSETSLKERETVFFQENAELRKIIQIAAEDLRKKNIELTRSNEKIEKYSMRLQQQHEEARCREEEHSSEVHRLKVEQLKKQVEHLECLLAEKTNDMKLAETEWSKRFEEQTVSAAAAEGESMRDHEALGVRVVELEKANASLEQQLMERESEVTQTFGELSRMRNQKVNLETNLDRLDSSYQHAQLEKEEANSKGNMLEKHAALAAQELVELRDQLKQTTEQLRKKDKKFEQASKMLERRSKKEELQEIEANDLLEEHSAVIEDLQGEVQQLELKLFEKANEMKVSKSEWAKRLDGFEKSSTEMKKELDVLRTQAIEQEEEFHQSRLEVDEINCRFHNLEQEKGVLDQENKNLQAQISKLRRQLNESEAEVIRDVKTMENLMSERLQAENEKLQVREEELLLWVRRLEDHVRQLDLEAAEHDWSLEEESKSSVVEEMDMAVRLDYFRDHVNMLEQGLCRKEAQIRARDDLIANEQHHIELLAQQNSVLRSMLCHLECETEDSTGQQELDEIANQVLSSRKEAPIMADWHSRIEQKSITSDDLASMRAQLDENETEDPVGRQETDEAVNQVSSNRSEDPIMADRHSRVEQKPGPSNDLDNMRSQLDGMEEVLRRVLLPSPQEDGFIEGDEDDTIRDYNNPRFFESSLCISSISSHGDGSFAESFSEQAASPVLRTSRHQRSLSGLSVSERPFSSLNGSTRFLFTGDGAREGNGQHMNKVNVGFEKDVLSSQERSLTVPDLRLNDLQLRRRSYDRSTTVAGLLLNDPPFGRRSYDRSLSQPVMNVSKSWSPSGAGLAVLRNELRDFGSRLRLEVDRKGAEIRRSHSGREPRE